MYAELPAYQNVCIWKQNQIVKIFSIKNGMNITRSFLEMMGNYGDEFEIKESSTPMGELLHAPYVIGMAYKTVELYCLFLNFHLGYKGNRLEFKSVYGMDVVEFCKHYNLGMIEFNNKIEFFNIQNLKRNAS